jgi:hypothetical protein
MPQIHAAKARDGVGLHDHSIAEAPTCCIAEELLLSSTCIAD